MGQSLGHKFHYLGEYPKCYVQAEWKDCDLDNSPSNLQSLKALKRQIDGNVPVHIFQSEGDELSSYVKS